MITIAFPDWDTEKRALAYLLGRFPGCVLSTVAHLVPGAARKARAEQQLPFIVQGKSAEDPAL